MFKFRFDRRVSPSRVMMKQLIYLKQVKTGLRCFNGIHTVNVLACDDHALPFRDSPVKMIGDPSETRNSLVSRCCPLGSIWTLRWRQMVVLRWVKNIHFSPFFFNRWSYKQFLKIFRTLEECTWLRIFAFKHWYLDIKLNETNVQDLHSARTKPVKNRFILHLEERKKKLNLL